MSQPVILAAQRTPIGRFFGGLARTRSPQLGAYAIEAVLNQVPAAKDQVDECIMGCVLQAGLGQNPARQAGLKAGLPETLSAQTINKVCGSGLQSVMLAAQSIKAGDNDLVVAGGFENMTAAPHFADVRSGVKFGAAEFKDHMQFDGLTCAFENWGMTNAADHIAAAHDVSREEQDRFSAQSHQRAGKAAADADVDAGHELDRLDLPLGDDAPGELALERDGFLRRQGGHEKRPPSSHSSGSTIHTSATPSSSSAR